VSEASDDTMRGEVAAPVYVIESIPVAGEHDVTPAEIRREGIPTPAHLRLFAELGVAIRSVSVARPSLDDVFMSYTGTTIRDAESGSNLERRNAGRITGR